MFGSASNSCADTSRRTGLVGALVFLALTCATLRSQGGQGADQKVDLIVIVKSARTMTLESGGRVLKTYKVALGGQPVGPKHQQSDHKTPEGDYLVDAKNPHSQFHMALHISYPNAQDRAWARKTGVNPGGDVEIHGLGKGFGWIGPAQRLNDWTDGCIAVTNREIEEIYKLIPVGTRVEIRP